MKGLQMPKKLHTHGWTPDEADHRDHLFYVEPVSMERLPRSVDLRSKCPPIFDQGGKIGSCTANAVCNAFRFNLMQQKSEHRYQPSRLFLHFNAREIAGKEKQNHGAQIRDAMKSVAKHGICRERFWPYVAYHYAKKPPEHAYANALQHQSITYQRIAHQLLLLKACLAQGHPFVFGITLFSGFETVNMEKTGILHLPEKSETLVGGHTVLAVGYNDRSERFILMNSWGAKWGRKGYFSVPYAYLESHTLASDFWTIRAVEDN
jgi:C1A family cysteine protease